MSDNEIEGGEGDNVPTYHIRLAQAEELVELAFTKLGDSIHSREDLQDGSGIMSQANDHFKEALSIYSEIGHRLGEAQTLSNIGNFSWSQGDFSEAADFYSESQRIYREIGDYNGVALTLANQGLLARENRDLDEAERLVMEALDIQRENDNREGEASSLGLIGDIAELRGNYEDAERHYRNRLRLVIELGMPLPPWNVENGYTDPDAEWDFPPENPDPHPFSQ